MRPSLARHRVLVTVPLSHVALDRLDVFFDVDIDLSPNRTRCVSSWQASLSGKAGVLIDGGMRFDAALLRSLPMLKAISLTRDVRSPADGHDSSDSLGALLDLDALTQAGIRATHVPTCNDADSGADADAGAGADPESVAVEGLVASLGFGRRSFHPRYLLNPEVACTSCC